MSLSWGGTALSVPRQSPGDMQGHCSSHRGHLGYPAALPTPFGIPPLSPADPDQGLAGHGGKTPLWDMWHGSATPCAAHQAFGFPLLSPFGPVSKKNNVS